MSKSHIKKDQLTVQKSPDESLLLTNCAIVHPNLASNARFAEIVTGPGGGYIFTLKGVPGKAAEGEIYLSVVQRRWSGAEVAKTYSVRMFADADVFFGADPVQYLSSVTFEIDLVGNKQQTNGNYSFQVDTNNLALYLSKDYNNFFFTVGQTLIVAVGKSRKKIQLLVKSLNVLLVEGKNTESKCGISYANTIFLFNNSSSNASSSIQLTGDAIGMENQLPFADSLLNPDFDFTELGVGGVDDKFLAIFRQVFASRLCPPQFAEKLGVKHVKGILLHGPPGTGKTLMARQISKMLTARPAKVIDGPQILDKYVGESEANVRKLFIDAEEEQKKSGIYSALHVIIFDEIDAICKKRGSLAGTGSGVHDTIVNQLLSKIDGVDQLNNLLIIGMTNRKDMIDEALLRPGRLEVHLEIGLPDKNGRIQILKIHTSKMKQSNRLAKDVNLEELAKLTKNFSGAELEALVKSATSTAINRFIEIGQKVIVDENVTKNLMVSRADFLYGLKHDIKPAFGTSTDQLNKYITNDIIDWNPRVVHSILSEISLLLKKCMDDSTCPLTSVLLEGDIGSGKTAIACKAALDSEFPFTKMCTPADMIGFTEIAKTLSVRELFFDAYKSSASCIVLDNIESLIDYAPVGPRFSNNMVQTIKLLLTHPPEKDRRLCVIGTTSQMSVIKLLGIDQAFKKVIHVDCLSTGHEVWRVLEHIGFDGFCEDSKNRLQCELDALSSINVGIKQLFDLIGDSRQAREEFEVACFLNGIARQSEQNESRNIRKESAFF